MLFINLKYLNLVSDNDLNNVSSKHWESFSKKIQEKSRFYNQDYSKEEILSILDRTIKFLDFIKEYYCAEFIVEKYFDNYPEKFNLTYVSSSKLSESFARRNFDKLDLRRVIRFSKYSESFLEEVILKLANDINWSEISVYQDLSECFIEKYNDKVDWYNISGCQEMTLSFIEKYKDKISFTQLYYNRKTSNEIKYFFRDKMPQMAIAEVKFKMPEILKRKDITPSLAPQTRKQQFNNIVAKNQSFRSKSR